MVDGAIGYYKLNDWWLSKFSEDQRNYLIEVYHPVGTAPDKKPLIEERISHSPMSACHFLGLLAGWVKASEYKQVAYLIIEKALKIGEQQEDINGLHWTYAQAIKTYYKDRDTDPSALDKAIAACKSQIAIAPKMAKVFKKEARDLAKHAAKYSESPLPASAFDLPAHTGFTQLAIILDKQKHHEEAIAICEEAKKQKWAGDWDKRIARYQKKLKK